MSVRYVACAAVLNMIRRGILVSQAMLLSSVSLLSDTTGEKGIGIPDHVLPVKSKLIYGYRVQICFYGR